MSNVAINIAAEFKGKKAFNQAGKSVSGLDKTVKKLAGTIGVAFSTKAIIAYGKASVKAFAEDEKSKASLSRTLTNLGIANQISTAALSDYFVNLEKTTAIVDDELRPALDRLLRATGDVSKAQELLGLALDISAGTGKSVQQVSQSLQKAYLGQTAALGRLGVGLSKSELASGDFEKIQKRLTILFKGQATTAANTYAGSLAKLNIASNNAKETIGKGLIDAITMLSSEEGIVKVTDAIDELATSIAETIVATAKLIKELKKIPVVGDFLGRLTSNPLSLPKELLFFGKGGLLDKYRSYGKSNNGGGPQGVPADIIAFEKTIPAFIKKNKVVVDNTAAIKKLTDKFDLTKIGLAAALKNPNLSADTVNRLKTMQSLENGNDVNAIKYGGKIKANASMANPNAVTVNVYPQGNVTTEQDLITAIQNGIQKNIYRQYGAGAGYIAGGVRN
jgi:hypothetical protein